MSKKLSAAFLVMIFALSVVLVAVPVQAHHTLGRGTWGALPYHERDFDPHVPGPLAYVWPGAGVVTLPTGSGAPSPVTWGQGWMSPPGYQSPWSGNPSGIPSSWQQLVGNTYAPFGAILTSTEERDNVGDLIFALNFSLGGPDDDFTPEGDYSYTSLILYIPPEFTPPVDWTAYDTSNIITTITNDYGYIYVWRSDVKDPFGPNWWVVYISAGGGTPYDATGRLYSGSDGTATFAEGEAGASVSPRLFQFTAANEYKEWYYIRINGMTAPKIAGKYMFKMFLNDRYPTEEDLLSDDDLVLSTVPLENYPVLLVKGEVDPGIIEGTVRFGGFLEYMYGDAIEVPGRVRAVGIADDPYTGASTGRTVEARAYFSEEDLGHYELEGVAPGVYDIYASALGMPETKVASGIKMLPGKSLHLDFYLNPGPLIKGKIFSKHSFGEVPWPCERPVTVEIYDSNEWPAAKPGYPWGSEGYEFEVGTPNELVWTDTGYQLSVPGHLKSFSPINLTDSPFTSYVYGNVIFQAPGYTTLDPLFGWPKEISYIGSGGANEMFNGVSWPAQDWWTDHGAMTPFEFTFGDSEHGWYGAPMEFDGHIPAVFASWINGLTPGTYYLRAWINGYVQTDVVGNYVDYPFTVSGVEWAGDILTPMDLQTSSWINKTVHFHDLPGTLMTDPIGGPDDWRYLVAEAYDADNVIVAMNFTQVPADAENWPITLNGFGMAGPDGGPFGLPAVSGDGRPDGMKFFLYRYRHIRDYGIMPGTYTIRVYMRGYIQQEFEMATISLSQSPAIISNHMYRGAGINVTLYSIDWEHPRIDREWLFPYDRVRVYVYDSEGNSMGYIRYWDGGWTHPVQPLGSTTIPDENWPIGAGKLKYHGSWDLEAYGPDLEGWLVDDGYDPGTVNFGGVDGSEDKTDAQTGIWLEFGWDWYGFLVNPWRYRTDDLKSVVALETDTYELKAFTLGYVQKKPIFVYAQKGQQADTKLNLVQGVNITAIIKFKKEGLFTELPYNSSVRIRVFDEDGYLAATWLSSMYDASGFYDGVLNGIWDPDVYPVYAYGGYGAGPSGVWHLPGYHSSDLALVTSDDEVDFESQDMVIAGTRQLQVLLAGNYWYWEIDQFAQAPSDERIYRSYGIDGWPNYQGDWTIEVDVVNWYYRDIFFPAPPGLLLGESYHIINGVEGPYGGIFKYNHLGPWEQKMTITVPNAHLGAEASVVFELDLRGLVSGQIAGFTWSDELRPVSWASITASGAAGTFTHYSWDGYYDMYLQAGNYELTVEAWEAGAGYSTVSSAITVSTGQLVTGYSFYLERSNIAIPEFPVAVIGLISALGASLCILRRTRRKG